MNTSPIYDVVLFCPKCGLQHLDVGEWRERPHHKHYCETTPLGRKTGCGTLWQPYENDTRGVFTLDRAVMADSSFNYLYEHFRSHLGEDIGQWDRDAFTGVAFGAAGLTHEQSKQLFERWLREMAESQRQSVLEAMAAHGTTNEIIEHLKSIGWKPPT